MKIEAMPLSVKGETVSHSGTVFLFFNKRKRTKTREIGHVWIKRLRASAKNGFNSGQSGMNK
ncbi:hypothetical protein [Bacillus atrophaeus]|uniref:hypothetical protein n=1 Tax=Bacillus atrophaeus TaxID=1452 RepID=UPI001EFAE454|nr:hypothetical protein [Bacillus atrophaeus]